MLCSCLPALAEGGTHSVSFDRSEAELHVGDELTLTLTQTGGSVEPQYSVSDGTLLEITSGSSGCTVKCLAVGNGTATGTATAGTATATCTLTLKEAQLEPRTMGGLHFTSTPSTLEIGQTYNLQPVDEARPSPMQTLPGLTALQAWCPCGKPPSRAKAPAKSR